MLNFQAATNRCKLPMGDNRDSHITAVLLIELAKHDNVFSNLIIS